MFPARALARLIPSSARNSLARQGQLSRFAKSSPVPTLSLSLRRQPTILPCAAPFSTFQQHQERQKPVTAQLTAKLDSELSMEKAMRDPDNLPSHLKEFLENSDFELHDTPGKEEVVMSRKYGDETIRVSFSIDDLNNPDEDPDQMQEDSALMDDMDEADMAAETQQGGSSTEGTINRARARTPDSNVRVASEDSISTSDRPELSDEEIEEDHSPNFTSHAYITIEKQGKGALQIEAMAQDGLIVIENVYFYKDAKLVDPRTREDEHAVRDLYTGPPFGNLDEDLQLLFERYLEERGINSTLALFVPEYIDFKEQREYTSWLSGVKSFFE